MSIKKEENSKPLEKIREVFKDNFEYEIKRIGKLIEKYNYISMDTEFPGFVFNSYNDNKFSNYIKLKSNVDCLKLIQVGLTLSDENGNPPQGCSTWQFNFDFDVK